LGGVAGSQAMSTAVHMEPGGYKETSSVLADQWRPRILAQMGGMGGGGGAGSELMITAVHMGAKKLWISISIFNL
jgi:hypothetical protein